MVIEFSSTTVELLTAKSVCRSDSLWAVADGVAVLPHYSLPPRSPKRRAGPRSRQRSSARKTWGTPY
jgi:hypothetical protein